MYKNVVNIKTKENMYLISKFWQEEKVLDIQDHTIVFTK